DDVVAVAVAADVRVGDACVAGNDVGAPRGADVDPGVEVPGRAVGVIGLVRPRRTAEPLGDRTLLGPDEVTVATAARRGCRLGRLERVDLRLDLPRALLGERQLSLI